MKKTLFFITAAFFTAAVFTTSCKKDNPIDCTQKLLEVSSAASAYSLDASTENCIAYKNALQDYVNCDGVVDKASYQASLNDLTCQ